MDESLVRAQMTGDDFRRLTSAFYRRVKKDEFVGPVDPYKHWGGGGQRVAGLPLFRHAPFSIGQAERDRWLQFMDEAMAETGVPDLSVAVLRPLFRQIADFMRNREEPAASA